MVQENKQNRRYKQINFIGLQNIAILHNTLLATFIKLIGLPPHSGNPRTRDSGSAIDS
jgi:hypothetical protein